MHFLNIKMRDAFAQLVRSGWFSNHDWPAFVAEIYGQGIWEPEPNILLSLSSRERRNAAWLRRREMILALQADLAMLLGAG